jgi:hypothetical protein
MEKNEKNRRMFPESAACAEPPILVHSSPGTRHREETERPMMKTRALIVLLTWAALAGCTATPEPVMDVRSARKQFHYHRSFQFFSENPEFRFELAQLARAADLKEQYQYMSTREGRWSLLDEVASIEFDLDSALTSVEEYLVEKDMQVPLREIYPLLVAIEKFRPYSELINMDNALTLNDPNFTEKYKEYMQTWRQFNDSMRAYIRAEQTVPLKQDVMEFILRIYYTNYETLWGHKRTRGSRPPGSRDVFFD